MSRLLFFAAIAAVAFSARSVVASPLPMLWKHEATFCIPGVSPDLCEIAKISETRQAPQARDRLRARAAEFEADDAQRPAFRALLYLATRQSRMEANGSGATDSPEDPDGRALRRLGEEAVEAFERAPYESLPYLPIPLLLVIGEWAHLDPPRHKQMTARLSAVVYEKQRPLDSRAVSFLRLLAAHRGSYDAPGASAMFTRIRSALGTGVRDRGLASALFLEEASLRGAQENWDAFCTRDFGLGHLNQALVLLYRTREIAAPDFRALVVRARDELGLRRSWVEKQGRWNDEVQAAAWQADAMLDLLRRTRPGDVPAR